MSNEIINIAPITVPERTFKSAALNEATAKIAAIYANAAKYADAKNREIAVVLAKVAEEKSYVDDGFKSVADYAAKTFGIARQNAYALATAGKVYNDDSIDPAIKAFSPSKIPEIASLPADVLANAISSGEITPDTTQKALREFAKAHKADKADNSADAIVIDTYEATVCMSAIPAAFAELDLPRTLDEWDEYFCNAVAIMTGDDTDNIEQVKLPKGYARMDAKKPTVNRKLYFNRFMSVVVEFYVYKPKAQIVDARPKYTIEELQAMLAAAQAEQEENG